MTALQLAFDHWIVASILLLVAGAALSIIIGAAVSPFAPCRRGNCPRCNGTGSEERIRNGRA